MSYDENLFEAFRNRCKDPDRPMLVTEAGDARSFSELDQRSAQIANLLSERGVRPGDRVSVQVEKSPECLCLYLASLRAGFVYHPLNPGYKASELEYFIGNAEPSLVVCEAGSALEDVAGRAGAGTVLTLDADGRGSLAEGADDMSTDIAAATASGDDLAALLYSSGTTGVPKGIMLTHRNLLANTATLVDAWGFTADDTLLHALPIFHVHGLFVGIGCVLLSGAQMRWLPGYDVRQVMEHLPDCTVMMGVPTYYTRLLGQDDFDRSLCERVRVFISGSAPLLEETFHAFEERAGHRILERYGMTETNMNASNPLNGERRAGTVGPPLPGIDIRIVDDEGKPLPSGETGNLQVRGPNVFAGYWRMPEKTAEDFTGDGYFNTGDLGKIDDDGYVSIVGRNKDLIITGGLNVYPKEVELFIDKLDGVKESAVIGVPHADFGEAVVAVVVGDGPGASGDDILGACREQLANFKVPKKVVVVDELPRNTMAKVQKNRLREDYRELFD